MLVVAFLAVDAGSPSSILLNTLTVIFAGLLLGMLALVVLRAGSTLISEHLGSRVLGLAGCEKQPVASEIRHPYYAESLGKAVLK
jgi:hypothetical protein